MPLSQGEHQRCRAFVSFFQLSFVVLHLKLGQGKLAMGNAKNSGESVYINRDGRQRGTSEQRIRLVIPRLSQARIIHECRCEAFETEARRGFSQVRPTEAYLQSVEEAEREKPSLARGLDDVAGIHE